MKRLAKSVSCALVFGLCGCTVHVHGASEARVGQRSTRSAGGERPATATRPRHTVVRVTGGGRAGAVPAAGAGGRGGAAVAHADARAGRTAGGSGTHTSAGAVAPANATAGGAQAGGDGQPRPTPVPPVNVGADGGLAAAGDASAKPVPPVNVSAAGGSTAVAAQGVSQPAAPDQGGATAAGGRQAGRRPVPPVHLGSAGALAAAAQGRARPAVAAAAAQGRARPQGTSVHGTGGKDVGDVRLAARPATLAAAKTAKADHKPTRAAPVTKDNGSNSRAREGAFAMVPASGGGKGQLRVPVPVTGLTCKVSQGSLQAGAVLRLTGKGFAPAAKVTVGGIGVKVRSTSPSGVVVQLPPELRNGGDVVLRQGDVVTSCGTLKITPVE